MRIVYVGPARRVQVPALSLVAERGKPITVKKSVADSLLSQSVWQAVTEDEQPTTEEQESN